MEKVEFIMPDYIKWVYINILDCQLKVSKKGWLGIYNYLFFDLVLEEDKFITKYCVEK